MGLNCTGKYLSCYLIFDILLYLSVLLSVVVCYSNLAPPSGGYFQCDDKSIMFPYQGDTVSTKILLIMVFLPFILIVFATELFQAYEKVLLTGIKIAAATTGQVFLRFWVSLTFSMCINLAMKTLTAVPRPHFIDTCQPRWDIINCSAHGGNVNINLTLCKGYEDNPDSVTDAIKSFPSGHAQISCFAAAFTIVYLYVRLDTRNSYLLRYWLQLVLVVMAIYSCQSRVSDHRHHVMDVVVGGAIGIVIGVSVALQHTFPLHHSREEEKEPIQNHQSSRLRLINTGLGTGTVTDVEKDEKPKPGS